MNRVHLDTALTAIGSAEWDMLERLSEVLYYAGVQQNQDTIHQQVDVPAALAELVQELIERVLQADEANKADRDQEQYARLTNLRNYLQYQQPQACIQQNLGRINGAIQERITVLLLQELTAKMAEVTQMMQAGEEITEQHELVDGLCEAYKNGHTSLGAEIIDCLAQCLIHNKETHGKEITPSNLYHVKPVQQLVKQYLQSVDWDKESPDRIVTELYKIRIIGAYEADVVGLLRTFCHKLINGTYDQNLIKKALRLLQKYTFKGKEKYQKSLVEKQKKQRRPQGENTPSSNQGRRHSSKKKANRAQKRTTA